LLTTIFKDLPVGERVKVAELRNLVAEDPAFQNLSTELEEEMKQAVLDHRELKKVGARPTNKSAAQDYRGQLTQMNFEVRFPLAALIFLITLFRLMLCLKERELRLLRSLAAPTSKTLLSRTGFAPRTHHISLRRLWIMGCGI
jgi:hypothetical protein